MHICQKMNECLIFSHRVYYGQLVSDKNSRPREISMQIRLMMMRVMIICGKVDFSVI